MQPGKEGKEGVHMITCTSKLSVIGTQEVAVFPFSWTKHSAAVALWWNTCRKAARERSDETRRDEGKGKGRVR